ncbi:uncharacterized protein Z519_05353 [Cladophialophora bantiana CBS 173.52]|uniref:Protein kinase domain-containing protein n=1 Tax=Cladophialophora bantiana (strain ATCC 10958 / CBS 173.52 / CDC B-1940 / NIH 8579) TaxID=1442370 RepID=A0A0D2G627_CLAB1|nr:uncharacterized protein Z519_05353 [Cladophialophora bantiana CBS 173.52]KIW94037.1 hypothetical protein Z519_05353 [Cladophialophora bantiana CBS 173.52]
MTAEQGSPQPDLFTDPEIQSFLTWKEENSCQGITFNDGSSYTTCQFVPDRAITEYFDCSRDSSYSKVKKLVAAATIHASKPPLDVRAVAKHCPKVFTILVTIGHSQYIDSFVRESTLRDSKLPFLSDKRDFFPKLGGGATFFDEFYKTQWQFCVEALSYSLGPVRFENDRILPITSMQKVDKNDGSSASVHKFTIHEEYDELCKSSDPQGDPHEYVVKSYYPLGADDYYSAEVEAFRKLNESSAPMPNLIGFYGAFTQNQSRHIILEYANVGTLEEYWKKVQPPKLGQDIVTLWDNFFKLNKALVQIHENMGTDRAGRLQIFQGCHEDIKPSNILVSGDVDKKPYDVRFMLADLGLSHFSATVESDQSVTRESRGGSQAYGAPELNRARSSSHHPHISKAPQSGDTWSLACVYSEFHAWTVDGLDGRYGVRKYRQERMGDVGVDKTMGACFHDKTGHLLRKVRTWHADSQRVCAREDSITPILWDKLLKYMFEPSPSSRLRAHQVLRYSEDVIEEARNKLTPSSASDEPETAPYQQNGSRPMTPPQLPPELQYQQLHGQSHVGYPWTPPDDHRIELPHNWDCDHSPRLAQSPSSRDADSSSLNRNGNRESSSSICGFGRDSFTHGSASISIQPEPQDKGPDHVKMPLHDRAQTELLASRSADVAHTSSNPHSTLMRSPTAPLDTFSRRHQPSSPGVESLLEPAGLSDKARIKGKEKAVDTTPSGSTHNRAPSKSLTVRELIDWVQQTQESRRRFRRQEDLPLPYENELIGHLKKRDHVFILDDSESMDPYWPDLTQLYGSLIYMIKKKELDPNGSELRFIISDERKEERHTTKLKNMVRERGKSLTGESDFAHRLDEILEAYQKKLAVNSDTRPISLYVFTDGRWQPGDRQLDAVARSIKRLVDYLEKRGKREGMVGIQFIRFGNDEVGIERLRWLDEDLKEARGLARDICDTTNADGNVWKMLLGSINGYWDAD